MTVTYPDVLVVPLLRDLRDCVAEHLAWAYRLPCRFPITFGDREPPADACDCVCGHGHGQGWARWVSTEPADLGGSTGAMRGAGCADGTYQITVEIGVYRCWPVPGEAQPLEEHEEERAAVELLVDAAAIRRALLCCPSLEDRSWELTKEEPVARSGGCTGVLVQLRVLDHDCDCSGPSSTRPAPPAPDLNWPGRRAP